MNNNDPSLPPHVSWRQKLMREELTDRDQLFIKARLGVDLYGYRKPEQFTIGFRVLAEREGRADRLLMRRNFTEGGFFFDLDRTAGVVGDEQSEFIRSDVKQAIRELGDQ
jgi:hypothetical protein